jgi:DNA helicase-2/ATP-dependent DNA helicase PcrA
MPLQVALNARNIPYAVFGGMRFNETAHVKDVCAHLKLVINPKDALAWNRALTLLPGVGPVTAERLTERLVTFDNLPRASSALADAAPAASQSGQSVHRLSTLLSEISDRSQSVGDRYDRTLEYYRPILTERYDDWGGRVEDLESLRQIASRYSDLEDLLADITIEPPEKGVVKVDASSKEDEKPLILSTIHSAKGLEWEVVFLLGVTDGLLPLSRALDDEEDLEEEHRLFYVAVTRARRQLFLTMHHYASGPGVQNIHKPSRFVEPPNVRRALDFDTTAVDAPSRNELPEEVQAALSKDALLQRIAQLQGRA